METRTISFDTNALVPPQNVDIVAAANSMQHQSCFGHWLPEALSDERQYKNRIRIRDLNSSIFGTDESQQTPCTFGGLK